MRMPAVRAALYNRHDQSMGVTLHNGWQICVPMISDTELTNLSDCFDKPFTESRKGIEMGEVKGYRLADAKGAVAQAALKNTGVFGPSESQQWLLKKM